MRSEATLLLWMLSVGTLCADLVWEDAYQEFQRTPSDRELHVHFAYRNTGLRPVTFTKVAASCGCVATQPARKTVQPGEAGTLPATFTFGGRRGRQTKTVSVTTDDGRTTPLTFTCLIAEEPVTLAPSFVYWRVGEQSAEKVVKVAVTGTPQVRVTAVASSNPRISASLKGLSEGGYAVAIRPADTARPDTGEIFIQTDHPPEGPKAYTVHVRIK